MFEVTDKKDAFLIKGNLFTLTTLQIISNDIDRFSAQLTQLINQAPKFFQNAPIVVDLQSLPIDTQLNFKEIVRILRHFNLIPVGIRGGSKFQQQAAVQAGMAVLAGKKSSAPEKKETKTHVNLLDIIRKDIRKIISKYEV